MNFQGADTDPFLQTRSASAQQGAAAGGQFFQAKGLPQDVIGPCIEKGNDGFRSRAGCQHHHRAVELSGEAQGRSFFEELRADKKVGSLALADLKSFSGGANGSSEMTVLAQTLSENGAEGGVGVYDENTPGMTAVISVIRLCHESLI
jgi:hypothetical protein